jgi:hypothetical protein
MSSIDDIARAEEQRVKRLLRGLVVATQRGGVEWTRFQPGRDDAFTFHPETGQGWIVIGTRDQDTRPPYDLLVFDQDGTRVAEMRWSSHTTNAVTPEDHALRKLFTMAYDAGTKRSEILDNLVREVEARARGTESQES